MPSGSAGCYVDTSYLFVRTEQGIFIFKGDSTGSVPGDGLGPETTGQPFTLAAVYPPNMGDEAIKDHFTSFYTTENPLAAAQSAETALTFALNLVPTGGALDNLTQGNYTEAGISAAADSLLLAGGIVKALSASRASLTAAQAARLNAVAQAIARAETSLDIAVGGYRVGQSYHNVTSKEGSKAEGAGQAGEALLRILSGALSAKSLAKQTESPRGNATPSSKIGSVGAAQLADDFHFSHNRRYELNRKHGTKPRIQGGKYFGKRPTNPLTTLPESVALSGDSKSRRIGYDPDTDEITIFDRDRDWWDRTDEGDPIQLGGIWHGHVRPWDQLNTSV